MESGVWLFVILLSICSGTHSNVQAKEIPLRMNCPKFVTEGESLDCECYSTSQKRECKPQWTHGQSEREPHRLIKQNLTRQDNGTNFTCEMECDDHTHQKDYVLQIAYGPFEGGVRVHGHSPFLTDGKRKMTLNCSSKDVNPEPQYTWSKVHCENLDYNTGKTCEFAPWWFDDGNEITCTALNRETLCSASAVSASAVFKLNLTYPPLYDPELSVADNEGSMHAGDSISCNVTGGKPVVSKVQWSVNCTSCTWEEETTNEDGRAVTSKLRVSCSESQVINCRCFASWEPDPELYSRYAHTTIRINPASATEEGTSVDSQDKRTPEKDKKVDAAIVGPILGGILLACVLITLIVWNRCDSCNGYTDVEIDLHKPEPHPLDVNPYDVVDVTGAENPEIQIQSPDSPAQRVSQTRVVSPCSIGIVPEDEEPAPKPCSPTSHFDSFGVSPSLTRRPGPKGDQYTLVDKKRGVLPLVHEENSSLLRKNTAEDGVYDKLHHDRKICKLDVPEPSPYNRINDLARGSPPCRGGSA